MSPSGEISRLIQEWRQGSKSAENALYEALYRQLHAIALHCLRTEPPGNSLGATGLIHEAYLRFRHSERLNVGDSQHFLRLAARVMHQILVDRARARRAAKRQGGALADSNELESVVTRDAEAEEIIAVDRALEKLAKFSPRQAQVVELRYFAGFSEEETGSLLEISTRTVRREWQVARARLRAEIDGEAGEALEKV